MRKFVFFLFASNIYAYILSGNSQEWINDQSIDVASTIAFSGHENIQKTSKIIRFCWRRNSSKPTCYFVCWENFNNNNTFSIDFIEKNCWTRDIAIVEVPLYQVPCEILCFFYCHVSSANRHVRLKCIETLSILKIGCRMQRIRSEGTLARTKLGQYV